MGPAVAQQITVALSRRFTVVSYIWGKLFSFCRSQGYAVVQFREISPSSSGTPLYHSYSYRLGAQCRHPTTPNRGHPPRQHHHSPRLLGTPGELLAVPVGDRRRASDHTVYTKIGEGERRNSKLPGLCHQGIDCVRIYIS